MEPTRQGVRVGSGSAEHGGVAEGAGWDAAEGGGGRAEGSPGGSSTVEERTPPASLTHIGGTTGWGGTGMEAGGRGGSGRMGAAGGGVGGGGRWARRMERMASGGVARGDGVDVGSSAREVGLDGRR